MFFMLSCMLTFYVNKRPKSFTFRKKGLLYGYQIECLDPESKSMFFTFQFLYFKNTNIKL
jgi:hypothetical protein